MGFVFEQTVETESLLKPIFSADEVPGEDSSANATFLFLRVRLIKKMLETD